MADDSAGEKILPASARKKSRLREEGTVPRSSDLTAAWSLTVALLAFYFVGPAMFADLLAMTRYYLGSLSFLTAESWSAPGLTMTVLEQLAAALIPFFVAMLVAGVFINVLQVGPLYAPKAVQPKWSRVDPIAGLKRVFGVRALIELIKSILKLALISTVAWMTLSSRWEGLITLMELTPWGAALAITDLVFAVWWRVAALMLFLAVIDLGYQRWQFERDQRMTRREAADEAKEMEGDPRVKQRIRQIQRQLATQRMLAAVPEADVIVTNPIRFAVALRYDDAGMEAPVVIAKGARLLAKRIREIAEQHDVPIVQRPPLARTLYHSVDIGRSIPENLFRAVAEVLAYVYQIDKRVDKRTARAKALNLTEPISA